MLQAHGVHIERYVAVDINPNSSAPMEEALRPLLPAAPLHFVTEAFEAFSLERFLGRTETPALATMLGFQEGNDHPAIVDAWLSGIARPGDLLLSESQLYEFDNAARIAEFYRHPLMQRFSRLAFEKGVGRNHPSLNRVFLLPVKIAPDRIASVAILAEEFAPRPGQRKLFVTNFCLKLTGEQYAECRTCSGAFEILSSHVTGDQTIVFQLSRRTAFGRS